jgi:uncharacterized lipoprotein YddW (UPF0748 family)
MKKLTGHRQRAIGLAAFAAVIYLIVSGCKTGIAPEQEVRGLWLHPGVFSREEPAAKARMDTLFDAYRDIGINNLFCYNTLPDEHGMGWDYLQALIDHAHPKGIKIHPIFYPGYDVNLERAMQEHPTWLIRNLDGSYYPAYNMALPEVRQYWLDRISHAFRYDIDGIHLDYMRFPITQRYSYDSTTCALFKRESGFSPLEVSKDCGSMIWCEWIKWNSDQVTELLKEIRTLVRQNQNDMLLGVDVFPDRETANVLIAQDWGRWTREGLVDFICPMHYTNNLELFREYTAAAVAIAGNNCRVYSGIGVHSSHNTITAELLIREIEIAREEGAQGVVFFSGYSLQQHLMDSIRTTLLQQP